MPSIFTEYPFVPEDYPASAALLDITPSQMQEVAERLGLDDPSFLSRMDLLEEHLNSDMTFEQYANLLEDMPCPCADCISNSGMSAVEYSIEFFQRLQRSWATLINVVEPYVTPPNSPIGESFPYEPFSIAPTNQEMHAINGNLDWKPSDGMDYSEMPYYNQVAGKWFEKIATKIGENSPDISGRLANYLYPETMERLRNKPPKLRKDRVITNKQQHVDNGNTDLFGDRIVPDLSNKFQKQVDKISKKHKPLKPVSSIPPSQVGSVKRRKTAPPFKPIKQTDDIYDNNQGFIPPKVVNDKILKGENPGQIPFDLGPSNKEMHSYNGNPVILPRKGTSVPKQNKTRQEKTQKKRKRTRVKPALRWRKVRLPRGIKGAARIENREEAVAKAYTRFLKTPSLPPPRIGSSGTVPTKLMHGMWKTSFNMSSIVWGAVTVTNATAFTACINPRMFRTFVSGTNFTTPILVCATVDSATKPNVGDATGNFNTYEFSNDVNLKLETNGSTSVSKGNPLARYLGGSITLDCRCPMTTTAPPSMFGGTTYYPTGGTGNISKDKQINVIAPATLRALPESADVAGFTVSSVYSPTNTSELEFNATTCMNEGTANEQRNGPVPYVGCVNCPTSAVITITVSGWFEVQPFINNDGVDTSFYSGWKLGPKISTEDIFDHLPRFKTTSNRLINQGVKANSARGYESAVMAMERKAEPPPIQEQLNQLATLYHDLKLRIDEEEDEKYFDTECTPQLDHLDASMYHGLSKSTIDLAKSIKKSLTPGSVTNKTVPITQS